MVLLRCLGDSRAPAFQGSFSDTDFCSDAWKVESGLEPRDPWALENIATLLPREEGREGSEVQLVQGLLPRWTSHT